MNEKYGIEPPTLGEIEKAMNEFINSKENPLGEGNTPFIKNTKWEDEEGNKHSMWDISSGNMHCVTGDGGAKLYMKALIKKGIYPAIGHDCEPFEGEYIKREGMNNKEVSIEEIKDSLIVSSDTDLKEKVELACACSIELPKVIKRICERIKQTEIKNSPQF